jgi:hypothetical protein
MATLKQLETALFNADKAGDMEAARQLAAVIQRARAGGEMIPDGQGVRHVAETLPKKVEPTIGERIIGAGEAGLALATGATGGAAGHIVGTLRGLADQILSGNFGTQQAAQAVAQSAEQGAQQFTYAPRTEAGMSMTQAVAEPLSALAAVAPMTAELGAASQAVRTAVPAIAQKAGQVVAPMIEQATKTVAPLVKKVTAKITPEQIAKMTPEQSLLAETRAAKAESLPTPINLTEGQKTRDFAQQQFERETAKQPELGAPLRERFAEQRAATSKNFDSFLEATGAETQSHLDAGSIVSGTIQKMFKNDKNKVNALYKEAEKAGEMEAPVALDSFIKHLNESAPEAEVANVLKAAKQKAISLGAAIEDEAGNLIAQPVPLKTVGILRRSINDATNFEPTNIRQSAIMKGAIDEGTDGIGGALYQKARQARTQLAKDYQNTSLVKNIIGLKKGSDDRAIAAENVFNKAILNSSLEDATRLRDLLQKGGGEGVQAWNELKGATVRYIKEEATKGISRDEAGNAIISPAQLDRVIKALDKNKKLDLVLGQKGADQMRVINDVAKDAFTSPPNSVNYSNTAATILAAMDMAVSGTIGVPAPIMSSLRLLLNNIKDKTIKARVAKALGKLETKKEAK